MEKSFGLKGFSGFCGKLAAIRSTCLHAFSDISDTTESIDSMFMRNIPNWNYLDLPYVVEGHRLTLAGLLAILLCMGNKEMVSHLMASGITPLIGRIPLWHDYKFARGKNYPIEMERHLRNDLDHEIRMTQGNDVFSSIWGEYAFRLVGKPEDFRYFSDSKGRSSIYRVRGSWNGKKLTIQKGSYYHVYFSSDYVLEIADEDYFIKCANQVPPFLFVAYLYRKGVKIFNQDSLSEDDKKLFPKLNKAKFYVDKNIHIILLGKEVSDQRTIYQSAAPQAIYGILNLEWNLRQKHQEVIQRLSNYSTIKESLIAAGVEQKLVEDTLFLRNFLAHGCIFGDYIGMTETSFRRIELLDCIDVFKRLVETLRKTDPDVAIMPQQDIEMRLTEQLIDTKYKALSKVWFMTTVGERIDWPAYGKTMQRIGHSYVTEKVEDALAWFTDDASMNRYCIHRFHSAQKMNLSGIGEECPFDTLTIAEYMDNSIVDKIVGAELKKPFKKSGNHLIRYYDYK